MAQECPTDTLKLDLENPRFGLSEAASEPEALKLLRERADLKELIDSICEKGFERFEPLVGVLDASDGKIVILEGNRRLAAAKLILDPDLSNSVGLKPTWSISAKNLDTIKTLPVTIVNSRSDADDYIAFKHINGPSTWGSLAKAKFATRLFDEMSFRGSDESEILSSLSRRIGDSKQLMLRMLIGYKVFEQAIKLELLDEDLVNKNSLDFSHLYTMLQNPDTREYLGLSSDPLRPSFIIDNPIPETHYRQLGYLINWLFGNAEEDPLIKRQGTDRPKLTKILASAVATDTLQETRDFDRAAEEAGFGAEKWVSSVANLEATAKRVAAGISDLPSDMEQSQIDRATARLELSSKHVRGSLAQLRELFGGDDKH